MEGLNLAGVMHLMLVVLSDFEQLDLKLNARSLWLQSYSMHLQLVTVLAELQS